MFTNTSNFSQSVSSVIGTIVLSGACIMAAVGPARAANADSFKQNVEAQIVSTMRTPVGVEASGVATLAVTITADGSVSNVAVVKSSGNARFDRDAIRTANAVQYPSGANRTIAMVLGYNKAATVSDQAASKKLVTSFRNDRRQLLATKSSAKPQG